MKFLTTVLFFAIVLAAGCKLNPPETDTIYNIPDEFNLELAEIRDSATGKADLGMRLTTTKHYECENVAVDAETNWQPDNVLITLNRIVQPAKCTPGNAPASTLLSLGNRPDAEYACTISLAGAVSIAGTLNIGVESVRLSFEERAGVVVKTPILYRIPQPVIWGWVGYEKAADQAAAKQFLTELENLTQKPGLKTGFYGDFHWQSPTDFQVILAQPENQQTLPFVRTSTVPRAELEALLKKYRDDTAHPLTILFWTNTGRI